MEEKYFCIDLYKLCYLSYQCNHRLVENKYKISVCSSLKKKKNILVRNMVFANYPCKTSVEKRQQHLDSILDLKGNYFDDCILDGCLDWFSSQHTVTDL